MAKYKGLFLICVGGMIYDVYFSFIGICRMEDRCLFSFESIGCVNDYICLPLKGIGIVGNDARFSL